MKQYESCIQNNNNNNIIIIIIIIKKINQKEEKGISSGERERERVERENFNFFCISFFVSFSDL